MRKRSDLVGYRFGKLTVIERAEDYRYLSLRPYGQDKMVRVPRWVCKCDCGNISIVSQSNLISSTTRSCGCLRRENMRRASQFRWRDKDES